MNENQQSQEVDARAVINAHRRRNGVLQIGLLFLVCALVWWMATHGWTGSVLWVFVAYLLVSHWLRGGEICPHCRNRVSMLPDEGLGKLPELSRAIRMCPYCGADFSFKRAENPPKEQNKVS